MPQSPRPRRARRGPILLVAFATVALVAPAGVGAAPSSGGGSYPLAAKALFYSSDGMRPDLMEGYAAAGYMPTYKALMNAGVRGVNGMQPSFPPNTGVGWYSLMTGTWSSEHGSTNNTYFRAGDTFTSRTSFSAAGTLQADTLAAAAERAGKKVAQIDWTGGAASGIAGPTVDYVNFFSTRGVLAAPLDAGEQSRAAAFGVSYQVASFAAASGWSNVPAGDPVAPAMQTQLTVATTYAAQNPSRVYDAYIYDADVNGVAAYDHLILVRTGAAKDGSQAAANLAVGDFDEIKLTGADGLIGTRAGQTAGFYVKLITMAGNLSAFKLYFTSVERVIATCSTAACNALPAGGAGENKLEKYIADNLPTYVSADYAPLEARIIDEDTYVQQGRDLQAAYGNAVLSYILGTLQPNTDLAFVGYSATDEFQHQFLGLVTPTDMDGDPNPTYDDVDYNGIADGRVAIRQGYLRSAYQFADTKLALARTLLDGNPTTFVASDHGFGAQWYAVNARKVLHDAAVDGIPLQDSGDSSVSNCGATNIVLTPPAPAPPPNNAWVSGDLTKACFAGGTVQIYVNPTLPAGTTYAEVRTAVIDAFTNLTDPANPGKQVVDSVMTKEQLKDIDGIDALHPSRSGDVVVVLRPPYQFDAATTGVTIAYSNFFGQHGYMPDLVDVAHNINMHAVFLAAGPGVRHQDPVAGVRQIDLAPTLAFLLGIPGPANARGKILYNLTPSPGRFKEATVLYISDFHGQLTPLTQAADTIGPSYGIGGAAYLKPWFDWYRAEATDGSITITGGDAVGASPPISSFFGDKPTMTVFNMLGVSADTLGNHNFDRGSEYLRTELIPMAGFPYLSANLVFQGTGGYPAEWQPSTVFSFAGVKLGVIGYTLPTIADVIFPGYLDPFVTTDPATAINAEAAKLKSKSKVNAILAIGHVGGDGTDVYNPTGDLPTLANDVVGVNVVLGGHTHTQYIARAQGGSVLVAESPNSGLRFTRIRIVVDTSTKAVAYSTADYHKPWDIGVTPDAGIQALVDDLNTQLAPIFNTIIGNSTVLIPRADACGRADGRLCESLVGDTTTDALRETYGTDFAITNSGGLRADLTCPTADVPGDFCPPYTPTPYLISRGQVLAVLPFGNLGFTVTINGAELKQMLENGVSLMPSAQGRFPQVSGLCFTYDIEAPAGSRVTGAVYQAANGSCTGGAIDLTAGSSYTIAENDFMATGGDGYPNLYARGTTQNTIDQLLADWIGTNTPISPAIQHRVHCFDANPGVGNDCPAGSP